MPTSALYTDVGRVARALAFQAPETINFEANIGNTNIMLNSSPPSDWQVGTTLIIDSNNAYLEEIVTITATPNGTVLQVSALTKKHAVGAPIINGTVLSEYVAAASRWWDSATYTPAGFAYEEWVDKKEAFITNDGFITIPLSKPVVSLSDITSAMFQSNPINTFVSLDLSKAWIVNEYILKIVAMHNFSVRQGFAIVEYKGGYNPLPDDIANVVTAYAARLYK